MDSGTDGDNIPDSNLDYDTIEFAFNKRFGSFGLNYRPPRVGRNPKSGEKVHVPEKYVPHFKAGKELRERVDGTPVAAGHSAGAHPRTAQP